MKKIIALLTVFMLLVTAGCGAATLNTEKDDLRTVLTINGEKTPKSEFREFLNYYYVYYEINSTAIPTDKDSLDKFIENIYDSFVLLKMLETEVAENDLMSVAKADENYSFDAELAATTFMDSAKAAYQTEQELDEMIAKYNLTQDDLYDLAARIATLQNYSTIYFSYGLDNCDIAEKVAMTVNGVEIPAGYIYWEATNYIIEYYYTYYSSITSESSILSVFENIAKQIASAQGVIEYAQNNDITLTDEELQAAKAEAEMLNMYFGEDTMKTYYGDYLLNDEMIDKAAEFFAYYYGYSDKINENCKASINYTDSDLMTFFTQNAADYDESTVSAYHILTEDETLYKQIVDEVGGTPEGFMTAFEKYTPTKNELIKESTDLGAVRRGEMVTEFETAIFNASVGDVIENVKTTYGYHIIYVYAKSGTSPTLDSVKDKVITDYVTEKTNEAYDIIVSDIEANLSVSYEDYKILPVELLRQDLINKYSVILKLNVALAR